MRKFFFVFAFLMVSMFSFADSPLTSTRFYQHYIDNPLVYEASETHDLSWDMAEYILDANNPVAIKVAIVNALSWGDKAESNYAGLVSIAMDVKQPPSASKLFNVLDGKTLICFAYMKALSDYFDVKEALKIAKMAQKKDKDSYCVNFIAALILSQDNFRQEKWEKIYSVLDEVNNTTWRNDDLSDEAAASVMEYINEYRPE